MTFKSIYDFSVPADVREALVKRAGSLRNERSSFFTHWRQLSRFFSPRSARFFLNDRNRNHAQDYNQIYDNAGLNSVTVLGAGMMTGTTNPGRPWFDLTLADPDLASFNPVRRWLDEVVRRMLRVFARSNVYRVLHQMYEELGIYGTSAAMVLPDQKNIIHAYPITVGEFMIDKNMKGEVVSMYREIQKTVGATVKEFGLARCSERVQRAWNNRDLEQSVDILHAIEPRDDQSRDPDNPSSNHKPWRSVYLETGEEARGQLLRDSGFDQFPVLVPRWRVQGQDVYGQSPGMIALGDVKQLQQEQLRKGQAIDYKVRPPLQVPTELKDRGTELYPGGAGYFDPGVTVPFNQVGQHAGIRSMFEVTLDVADLTVDIEDVRRRIERAMHADLFLMLSLAGTNTRMTATEVAERHEEKLLILGPVLERLHNELLQPLIDVTFAIMEKRGMLPPAPPEIAGQKLDVEFISILAQAQQAIGGSSMERFVRNVLEIAAVKPDVVDKVNWDKVVERYGEKFGVDAELLVSDEAVETLRQARADAEAAVDQVAVQREQAASTRDLANAPTDGASALSEVIAQGAA